MANVTQYRDRQAARPGDAPPKRDAFLHSLDRTCRIEVHIVDVSHAGAYARTANALDDAIACEVMRLLAAPECPRHIGITRGDGDFAGAARGRRRLGPSPRARHLRRAVRAGDARGVRGAPLAGVRHRRGPALVGGARPRGRGHGGALGRPGRLAAARAAMSAKQPCRFTVLRTVHDGVSGESLNASLLLHALGERSRDAGAR